MEDRAERVGTGNDLQRMVEHIAKPALQLEVDLVLLEAALELAEHLDEGMRGALETHRLGRQFVDAPRHGRIAAEELILDLVDVVLEPRDHRLVVVDDLIEYRIEHGLRPQRQQRWVLFKPLAYAAEIRGFGVAHRDGEVGPNEDVHLTKLDFLRCVQVARRPQDKEKGFPVSLKLGALVTGHRIVHRQVVQIKLARHRQQFGLGGTVHANPGETTPVPKLLEGLVERHRMRVTHTLSVDRVVNDGDGRASLLCLRNAWLQYARQPGGTVSRRSWIVGSLVAVVSALVIVALITRPWLAFIDVAVDDTLPSSVPTSIPSPGATDAPAEEPAGPIDLSSGTFVSHEHETTGTVRIVQNPDGTRVLAIENLSTTNGPDVRVWLSAADTVEGLDGWFLAGSADYLELGPIKGNLGNQLYDIPADADLSLYPSVSLWCVQFGVSFGGAQLV